jgi:hypothetical protein
MTANKKTNILNHTSLIVLILAGSLLLAVMAGLVYPYKTIVFSNYRVIGTIERPDHIGKSIVLSWSFDKQIALPANYTISLVPNKTRGLNNTYLLESGTVNSPTGKYNTTKFVKLCDEVVPGDYNVRMTVEYQVNPFRKITRIFDSENLLTIK